MSTLTTPRRVSLAVTPNERAMALTGRPHISYSEIRTFQACPLKWHYQYVEKAKPEQLSAAMLLGTCVHAMIQRVLEAMIATDPLPLVDELMETYRATWERESNGIPIQFAKGQDEQTSAATARRMIETFLASEYAVPPGEIIGIEENFKVKLSPDLPDLAGRVDLVSHDDGVLTITDFKTARSIPTDEAANDMADQLVLYAEGCAPMATGLNAKIQLRYVYISKTKEVKVEAIQVDLDPAKAKRTKAVIGQVWQSMQQGVIYPASSPMNCCGCGFHLRCKTWNGWMPG